MLIVPPVRHDSRLSACFALSCLLMSLTRPEGVFLSIFMVCSVISYRSWKSSRLVRLWFFWVFLILGGAYFLWRWHYFGYPLPNPFYKKGGGHFHLDALQASIENTITFVNAYLVIIFLGILTVGTRKRTMFCLMPITAFTCLWVLMSNEMNHLYRFQYAIFPIINMSWPFIVVGLINQEFVQKLWNRQIVKFSGVTLAVLFFCFFSLRLHRYFENEAHSLMFQDPNYTVARSLKRFADLNYTMAVSEGGVLPLYSGWRCTDMWGLNDIWITHHGGVTSDYLNRSRPELIMFHAPLHAERPLRFSVNEDWWNLGKPWCSMVQVASQYANIKRYELVACKLDHDQNHAYYYFIKRDLKYKTLISQQIQGALCSSGEKCE